MSSRHGRCNLSETDSSGRGSNSPDAYSLVSPSKLSFSPEEAAGLELLMSIYDWSVSFLEDVNRLPDAELAEGGVVAPRTGSLGQAYDAENLSFSFRLITSLLNKGEGALAGRLARKSFMQMESILNVEAPLFVWNLFETIWNMLNSGQTQLARMLFAHLFNLAKDSYPSQHPVLRLLHSLQKLMDSFKPDQGAGAQLEAVRQGWAINADLLFTPPNPRLLLLFYRLVWDSDLIQLPDKGLRTADNLYAAIEDKVPAGPSMAADLEKMLEHDNVVAHHDRDDLISHQVGQLPENYNSLINQTVDEIHELCSTEPDGTIHKFRALSALLKSRMFENDASSSLNSMSYPVSDQQMPQAPPKPFIEPLHARTLAYVQRVIMEAEDRKGYGTDAAIGRLRDIISLREYGQDPTGPQVICELWQLEDLLSQSGRTLEADRVRRDSFQRLDRYIGDIPQNSVT